MDMVFGAEMAEAEPKAEPKAETDAWYYGYYGHPGYFGGRYAYRGYYWHPYGYGYLLWQKVSKQYPNANSHLEKRKMTAIKTEQKNYPYHLINVEDLWNV